MRPSYTRTGVKTTRACAEINHRVFSRGISRKQLVILAVKLILCDAIEDLTNSYVSDLFLA